MPDEPLDRDEQERLYAERERLQGGDDCDPEELSIAPDVAPVVEPEKCAEPEEPPEAEFLPANPPPGDPVADNALPGPLLVANQEQSATCSDPGSVALDGTDPNVVAAMTEVGQVYIDEISSIAQDEMFRLAGYVEEMQTLIDSDFLAAYNASDFATFDQALADVANTSLAVATLIRQALATEQATVDTIALTAAIAGLVCGWINPDVWVRCQDAEPGYARVLQLPAPAPPPTEVSGDIYVLDSSGAPHPDWDGAAQGAIVQFDGAGWNTIQIGDDVAFVPEGTYSIQVGQEVSDGPAEVLALALQAGALELNCLVPNEQQDVNCWQAGLLENPTSADATAPPPTEVLGDQYTLDQTAGTPHPSWDGAVQGDIVEFNGTTWDVILEGRITWPVNWTFATDADEAARGNEVVTLAQQGGVSAHPGGAADWTITDWDDFASNTAEIALLTLNGQQFRQLNQIGTGESRTLRTRVIIDAADPRAAAPTQAEANEIAFNLAVQELDCFYPNRPRVISCMTQTYGSEEVYWRAFGDGVTKTGRADIATDDDAGRDLMYAELNGGAGGGPGYERDNRGILDYGTASEASDGDTAFEVRMWPGFLDANQADVANEVAGNYASGFLQCLWISPSHGCDCLGDAAAVLQEAEVGGDPSALWDESVAEANTAVIDTTRAKDTNIVERGLFQLATYPNADNDPEYNDTLQWPDLADICKSGLSCLFISCKVVCCEPKPDDRPYKVNGMVNYASWGANWSTEPSTRPDHNAFIATWINVLSQALVADFIVPPTPCQDIYVNEEDADGCLIASDAPGGQINAGDLGDEDIVHRGPGGVQDRQGFWGAPARFKYGGVLLWGNIWADPGTSGSIGEGAPGAGDPGLQTAGEIKDCHQDEDLIFQEPDPWGFYSCAEGVAESFTPVGLGEQAMAVAQGRLICTHVSWPRHLVNCPQPGQRPFGPPVTLDIATEGASTREANETMESMLLGMMECQDPHNYMVHIEQGGGGGGGGKVHLPAPSVANVGGKDECLKPGLQQATLLDEDCQELPGNGSDLDIDESSHIFIEVTCRCGTGKKELVLIISPDDRIDDEIRKLGILTGDRQLGELGLPSGRDRQSELEMMEGSEDSAFWYIASVYVDDQAGNWPNDTHRDRIAVQAHTGPILIGESCCPSASGGSSLSGGSGGGSGGSSGSSSGSSEGSSAGPGSGSDKSTAIVPMPWHEKEFGALFTMESNEVLFEFVMRDIPLAGAVTEVEVDPRFAYVCEEDSLVVAGQPNSGKKAAVAADVTSRLEVDGEAQRHTTILTLKASRLPWRRPKTVTLKLTGVRKGFLGMDMPQRSRRQFEANEAHLNSIYPAEEE